MTEKGCSNQKVQSGRLQRQLRVALRAVAALAVLSSAGGAHAGSLPPAEAQTMTGVELYFLYRDKTWRWADGAGRMEDLGRVFRAYSGSGDSATWAEGRWIVTDSGRLCFDAEWHTRTGSSPGKTCFSHKIHDGTIYQRKEPSGDWYTFKSSEPKDSDEFKKLVKEDLVSAKLETIRNSPQGNANPEETPSVKQTWAGEHKNGETR